MSVMDAGAMNCHSHGWHSEGWLCVSSGLKFLYEPKIHFLLLEICFGKSTQETMLLNHLGPLSENSLCLVTKGGKFRHM